MAVFDYRTAIFLLKKSLSFFFVIKISIILKMFAYLPHLALESTLFSFKMRSDKIGYKLDMSDYIEVPVQMVNNNFFNMSDVTIDRN